MKFNVSIDIRLDVDFENFRDVEQELEATNAKAAVIALLEATPISDTEYIHFIHVRHLDLEAADDDWDTDSLDQPEAPGPEDNFGDDFGDDAEDKTDEKE